MRVLLSNAKSLLMNAHACLQADEEHEAELYYRLAQLTTGTPQFVDDSPHLTLAPRG